MKVAALDAHKSYSQVCVMDRSTDTFDDFRVESTPESIRGLSEAFIGVERVALEASSHWSWIVDELEGMGLEVVLSHPSKTKAIGSAKIKTDKIDARMLAYLLSADLLPEAHIPSLEVRERRSYLRYRYTLVCARTSFKNRVHSILAGYGFRPPCKDLFCKKGIEWLGSRPFREMDREQVEGYLGIIEFLNTLIGLVDQRIKPLAQDNDQARLLMSVKGIGYYSALLILSEIDGVERFASAKHLVSYAGLCPSTRSSGGKERHGHITRSGSRFLRWICVEAAQKATFKTNPMHKFYYRIKCRKGHSSAKTAVARKLLESIYQMLKRGEPFDAKAWA
jgi:transposase